MKYPLVSYMSGIYVRPLLAGLPALALTWALKISWLPGRNWAELGAAGCLSSLVYLGIAFYACVAPNHREMFLLRIPVLGPHLIPRRA